MVIRWFLVIVYKKCNLQVIEESEKKKQIVLTLLMPNNVRGRYLTLIKARD